MDTVCKLDPSGVFQWVAQFGGDESQLEWVQDLVTDAAGNIYVAGAFGGTADFDPGAGVTQLVGGVQDGYLLKLSPAGELIWAKKDIEEVQAQMRFLGLAMTAAEKIADDSSYVQPDAYVDGNTIPLGNTQNGGLVASFQPDGAFNWARVLPGNGGRNITDVWGPDGSIHGCGIFSTTLDLDPGPGSFPVVAVGDAEGFYFKLDAVGTFLWGGRRGGILENWGYDMDVDQDGAMYLAGHFRAAATIGYGADPAPDPSIRHERCAHRADRSR